MCDPDAESWVRPPYWETACAELRARDPKMAELIAQYDGELLGSHGDPFVTLARAIVGQQVSVAAADRLWERLTAAVDGVVSPERVWAVEPEALRGAGLSARKVEYLRDLARHAQEGSLDPERWAGMSDEVIIGALTAVRGIGRWTAEMFLIFHLMRPNVLPLDDVGLINGISQNYFSGDPVSRSDAREVAQAWQPWCSVATWYIWRSLDPLPVTY